MAEVAWYDVKMKGWVRDFIILLHPPYSLWHLSYIPIGAALAPVMNWATLGWTLLAFFLGMGIGAHCADELRGRPLRTKIPGWILALLCVLSLGGAVYIGVAIGLKETIWILPLIIFGVFIVFAYNLELFRGFFHTNFWFGFAWGAFPAITAYVAQTHTVSPDLILLAAACLLYSMTQRVLSLQCRFWRRKVTAIEGHYFETKDYPVDTSTPYWGQSHNLTKETIMGPAEVALKFMTWTVVAAAVGLLLLHI